MGTAAFAVCASGADAEVDDVAVLHDVVPPLDAQGAGRLAVRERPRLHQRVERDDLGPDEVLLEVRVDRGGRLHGVRPLRDRPRAAFVLAGREERHEAEEVVRGVEEAVERAVRQAETLEELGLVLGRQRRDLLLDRRRDGAERDVRLALPRVEFRRGRARPRGRPPRSRPRSGSRAWAFASGGRTPSRASPPRRERPCRAGARPCRGRP